MIQIRKTLNPILIVWLALGIPSPSSGLGMMKGGGGSSSSVAEILAAGLITKMLMSRHKAMPMIHHAMIHHAYSPMYPRHPMPPMYAARIPMMGSFVYPMMQRRPPYMVNQQRAIHHALLTQATQASHASQALTSRLNEEIRALEAHESMLEVALAKTRQGSEKALNELLNEEETIPTAALLLAADLEAQELLTTEAGLQAARPLPPPELFQAASTEPESRYILPRIVRHFVQRLMRRGRNHH